MKSIVSKQWLLARMYEPDVVIVDCRFALGKPEAGRESYLQSRIPGAVYLDLEQDLSGPVGTTGGRHPLPDTADFARTLRRAGISNESRVVAYDAQGGAMASRLWWLLRYVGHEAAYVLNGGYPAWEQAGYPIETGEPKVRIAAYFEPKLRPELAADADDVRKALNDGRSLLIDSRERARYLGEEEPIDAKAGHIPGAVNRFWKDALDANGEWKPENEQRARFADVDPEREIIVYCGSGVTACPNVLALEAAGYRNVKLYAGSWSDWISHEENPIATGEE